MASIFLHIFAFSAHILHFIFWISIENKKHIMIQKSNIKIKNSFTYINIKIVKGDLIMDSNQNKEMYPREEAKEVKQMDSHENDKADLLAIISGKPVVPYIVINNHNPCFSREEKGELYSDENNLIKKAIIPKLKMAKGKIKSQIKGACGICVLGQQVPYIS